MSRPILAPAATLLFLLALPGCKNPEADNTSGYGRYLFDLLIERDATAGFVCVASVTDQISNSTLRTQPFRAMPGKIAVGHVDEPVTGTRLEATIKVDAEARLATYIGRLTQKGQRTVTFESTRPIPKT